MPDHDHAGTNAHDLDELFPAGAVSVLSLAADAADSLMPEEVAATRTFSPVRVAEFTHGRNCARRALLRLGSGPQGIAVGPRREPLWPAGIVGSISHAGGAAAAVVARRGLILAIGLDVEQSLPLETQLLSRICRPTERAAILASGLDPGVQAHHLFSMKEAAYKALWPILHCFLDFQDLEIHWAVDASAFKVRSHSDLCPPALAARLCGRFTRRGELFASGVAIPA